MAGIECLLWDFGDTLCDERFIWSSGPDWMALYETFDDDGLGASWSLGRIGTSEFAAAVAHRLGRPAEDIVAHMVERCRHIRFFDRTHDFFRRRHLPQAIVTVNPDLFTEVIVPLHDLQSHCDVIVTSWEEGTDDKRILNRLAIERLGMASKNAAALLIDNKLSNIDQWAGVGGAGYHFQGDDIFARDAAGGVMALSASATAHPPTTGT